MTQLLNRIHSPYDLRQLPRTQLQPLADELRSFMLESVAQTGGVCESAGHRAHNVTKWCASLGFPCSRFF